MPSFIALYEGDSVAQAKIIGVTSAPHLVSDVATQLLSELGREQAPTPVVAALNSGRRRALRLVTTEAKQDARKGATP